MTMYRSINLRFWLPVGEDQRLPEAYHGTAAALYRPVPAWTFGVEAYWTEDTGSVGGTVVTNEFLERARTGSVSGRASVAYIIPYQTDSTGAMVMRLMQEDYRIAVSTRELNAGGRNWPAGTFVIRVSRNPESLHDAIARYSREMGVNVTAVNSGYADEGDTGIGGEVAPEHRERYRDAWKNRHPPGVARKMLRRAKQRSPTDDRRVAEPEEAESRFGEDRATHGIGRFCGHYRPCVGKHMAP